MTLVFWCIYPRHFTLKDLLDSQGSASSLPHSSPMPQQGHCLFIYMLALTSGCKIQWQHIPGTGFTTWESCMLFWMTDALSCVVSETLGQLLCSKKHPVVPACLLFNHKLYGKISVACFGVFWVQEYILLGASHKFPSITVFAF